MSGTTTLGKIHRTNGVAGQYAYTVRETYVDDTDPENNYSSDVTFVGSVYGPPIVMVMPSGVQVFVSDAVTDRIGTTLNPEWVRKFFAPSSH